MCSFQSDRWMICLNVPAQAVSVKVRIEVELKLGESNWVIKVYNYWVNAKRLEIS